MPKIKINLPPGKYVVAVSGGVDSVVLLHMLVSGDFSPTPNSQPPTPNLVVAHFDHGIRADSAEDRKFVQLLAKSYGLPFEYTEGKLGSKVSEATARSARYKFLNRIKKKHKADAIVTAHHQDDVIETAIINLLRGTGRKGLSSLSSSDQLRRPLLSVSRRQIESYAQRQGLSWREDPTNRDTRYLRNYVRLSVIPALDRQSSDWRSQLLARIGHSGQINADINSAIDRLADQHLEFGQGQVTIPKNWLIMLPNPVGLEVIRYAVEQLAQTAETTRRSLKDWLLFAKTAQPGKTRPLSKHLEMKIGRHQIRLRAVSPA